MSNIQRVLFAVDFSTECESLVPTVRRMIEYWHTEVTLLHVIQAKKWPGRKQELEQLMVRLRAVAQNLDGRYVKFRLERGAAGDRVLEYAQAHQVDLIVIAARGTSGLRRTPLGSVADQVLAEAHCRVWLDWGWTHNHSAAGMYARRVACALAHNESDQYVLSEAEEVSADLDAALTVIQAVCQPADRLVSLWRDRRDRESAVALAAKRIEYLRRPFAPPADMAVEAGSHNAVVSRVLQRQATGLLVTGNMREAILGAEAECPVLRVAGPAVAAAGAALEGPYLVAARKSA